MNQEKYTCDYCEEQYIPNRRGAQRFCNSKCRKKYSYHKNKVDKINTPKVNIPQQLEEIKNKKIKTEEMSWSGVGNAALGALAADTATALAKKIFISENKKPATKGDIQELKDLINTRYFLAHNVKLDPWGRKAYFDIGTGKILYLDENSNSFHIPEFNLG